MAIIKRKKNWVLEKRGFPGNENDEQNGFLDSGAGSDDSDFEAFDEIGGEFCQVGVHNCWIPFELYDLWDLGSILSVETWDNCLTEEERFGLCEFLPDMDQENFRLTLRELFSGKNFHFGSPIVDLFEQLKAGLCEPRVAMYRKGLNFFERKRYYHLLREYQNSMVGKLLRMQVDWRRRSGFQRMVEAERYGRRSPKGILKVKAPWKVNAGPNRLVSSLQSRLQVPMSSLPRQDRLIGYEVANWGRMGNQMRLVDDESEEEHGYPMAGRKDRKRIQEDGLDMNCSDEFGRNQKWKMSEDFLRFKTNGGLSLRIRSTRNAGIGMITTSDDTESDSSGCIGEAEFNPHFGGYSRKRKPKDKSNVNYFRGYGEEILEGINPAASANFGDHRKQTSKSGENGPRYLRESLHIPVHRTYSLERKQKGGIDLKFSDETW